jgi:hypothetical protein
MIRTRKRSTRSGCGKGALEKTARKCFEMGQSGYSARGGDRGAPPYLPPQAGEVGRGALGHATARGGFALTANSREDELE